LSCRRNVAGRLGHLPQQRPVPGRDYPGAGLKQQGLAILLVEQNLYSALAVADRAYVLETGKVVYEAEAAELAQDPQSLVRFLGVH